MENPRLQVVKHADLYCMEEVRLRDVYQDRESRSKYVESAMIMVHQEFGIGCLGHGNSEGSI